MENENIQQDIEEISVPCEDDTKELLEKYDRRSRRKADDVPAMQAVVCIIAAVFMFGLNILYPETAEEVFSRLNQAVFSGKNIFPNPIDLISELL
ncbi:MAG: hypothetical protein NC205_03405 [Prevotella sp.]|nr:hypothetical protein [Alistipes senegalensis]MCM1357615.1 hypothetical protein [Prevotella sp.]MCM1474107.1 hypothetical protein [Muribaculaceae bacterium]MDE6425708.1 hypothetical protein [Ruminococcus sp.]